MNFERLYLDYNATSPLSQSVLNWLKSGDVFFANPSSQHSDGKLSRRVINESRHFIFNTFNKSDKETKLFFHSGATEAIHTFAHSFAEFSRLNGKDLLICYSKMDHPAVLALSQKFFGSQVKYFELQRTKDLHYCHEDNWINLKDKKDNNPDLIILYHHLWVHNETGQVSDLEELARFKLIPDLFIHVDAVQAPGKIGQWQNLSRGDIWSFSAHKFGALKGIGFSFFHHKIDFHPLISGGPQQANLRAGTENIQGVKSIALALSDILEVDIPKAFRQREILLQFLKKELKDLGEIINDTQMASNTIYFYLNDLSSDIALALFDIHGIEISAGSACSSGAAKASAVLIQKGLSHVAQNGLRLSLPFETSDLHLEKIQGRLHEVFSKLRKVY